MGNYVTLRQGNSNTAENKKLQQALKDAGYGSYLGSAGVDGIYGSGTTAAVKAYQKANGLTEDGIAGNQTLGHLYGSASTNTNTSTQAATLAAEPAKSYRYDQDNDPVYQQALKKQEEVNANAPTYAGTFDQQVQELFDQVVNQKDFQYDLNGDALWQQYKDQYTTQGKLAMMDTMGQAAALTGGYGSSYAQNAGQQAYQGYLQQLNDRVPELYQLAMDKYNNEQAMLKDKFSAAAQMQADEYGKYQDALSQHNIDVDRAQSAVDTAYDRGNNAWLTEEQLRTQEEETQYARQQDSYDRLANLISSTGYTPSQSELAAAGMSQMQAAAYASYYDKTQKAKSGETEDEELSIPSEIKTQIGKLDTNSEKAAFIDRQEQYGTISSAEADYMRSVYLKEFTGNDNTDAFIKKLGTEDDVVLWRHRYSSYKNYVSEMIEKSGLTDEEKAYLIWKYEITEEDM